MKKKDLLITFLILIIILLIVSLMILCIKKSTQFTNRKLSTTQFGEYSTRES